MLSWLLLIVGLSVVLLLAVLFSDKSQQPTHSRYPYAALVLVLGILSLIVVHDQTGLSGIETKGAGAEAEPWLMVGLMYLSMLLGIIAQSYYFLDHSRPTSSWIKAALASPIIFIPLLSSYLNTIQEMKSISIAELMIFLVSFQNGFFWKVIFDKQSEMLGKQRN
ncbi:hypothetical protein I6F20_23530 [Bradyrhizobium sp. IC3123]|uniref:hypothetical protein n=1 Tax=Bradyrhizobium sp. IC3123 TaxID=2793803 RepID=UPI001CD672E9|nr:hypothetical protein [Bradyrhizobium sp. IC3123]MCA1392047.1 hypothetical protein [Bradyrhizobium sp. IC3123]